MVEHYENAEDDEQKNEKESEDFVDLLRELLASIVPKQRQFDHANRQFGVDPSTGLIAGQKQSPEPVQLAHIDNPLDGLIGNLLDHSLSLQVQSQFAHELLVTFTGAVARLAGAETALVEGAEALDVDQCVVVYKRVAIA